MKVKKQDVYRKRQKPEEELHTKKFCSFCRRPLDQDAWNTTVDILVCDNAKCVKYRQPAGSVPIIKTTMEQIKKEEVEDGH